MNEDFGQASNNYYSLRRIFTELERLPSPRCGADKVVNLFVIDLHVGTEDAPLALGSSMGRQGVLTSVNGGENVDEGLWNHASDRGRVTSGCRGAAHHCEGFACACCPIGEDRDVVPVKDGGDVGLGCLSIDFTLGRVRVKSHVKGVLI